MARPSARLSVVEIEHRHQHPHGQIPAYAWNISDVDPPMHACATHFVDELEKSRTGARRSAGWRRENVDLGRGGRLLLRPAAPP
jgi:hypothetical protein